MCFISSPSVFLSPVSPAWFLSRDYFLLHLCRTSHLASGLAFVAWRDFIVQRKKKSQQTDVDNEPSALSAFKPREKNGFRSRHSLELWAHWPALRGKWSSVVGKEGEYVQRLPGDHGRCLGAGGRLWVSLLISLFSQEGLEVWTDSNKAQALVNGNQQRGAGSQFAASYTTGARSLWNAIQSQTAPF